MKRLLFILIVSTLSVAAGSATAQSSGDKDDMEMLEEVSDTEKSKLTAAERTELVEMTSQLRALVGTIHASSTSRKDVKFASADLAKIRSKLDTYITEKKLLGEPAKKMPRAASGLEQILSEINAKLKAGETDDVEDALPALRSKADQLKELAAKIEIE